MVFAFPCVSKQHFPHDSVIPKRDMQNDLGQNITMSLQDAFWGLGMSGPEVGWRWGAQRDGCEQLRHDIYTVNLLLCDWGVFSSLLPLPARGSN